MVGFTAQDVIETTGTYDAWVLQVKGSDGSLVTSKNFGNAGDERFYAVALNYNEKYIYMMGDANGGFPSMGVTSILVKASLTDLDREWSLGVGTVANSEYGRGGCGSKTDAELVFMTSKGAN